MFGNIIYNRILKAVKEKIEKVQEDYDNGVKMLEEKFEADKSNLEEELVANFINKIL